MSLNWVSLNWWVITAWWRRLTAYLLMGGETELLWSLGRLSFWKVWVIGPHSRCALTLESCLVVCPIPLADGPDRTAPSKLGIIISRAWNFTCLFHFGTIRNLWAHCSLRPTIPHDFLVLVVSRARQCTFSNLNISFDFAESKLSGWLFNDTRYRLVCTRSWGFNSFAISAY